MTLATPAPQTTVNSPSGKRPLLITIYSIFSLFVPPALVGTFLYLTVLIPAWQGEMEIWRVYAVSVPVVLATGICFVFGILLWAMRKAWAVWGCAAGGILVAMAYCGSAAALDGALPFNWASLSFLAIPLLMLAALPQVLAEMRTAPPPAPKPPSQIHQVGTLRYTVFGVFAVAGWLLWGDFTMSMMEILIPTILPLKLDELGATPMTIVVIMSIIPNMMNFLVNPTVSFRSDRHRGPWGRRKPFLLLPTPFIALVLIAMAFAPEIGGWFYGTVAANFGAVGKTSVIIITLGVLMLFFQFFNMFISSVYWYLLNDVVPGHFLSRFMASFRIVGLIATVFFNAFLFKYCLVYTRYFFLGGAAIYFLGFLMMCWKVKEGRFPPPPPLLGKNKGLVASIRTYCKESFTHPFYLCLFAFSACHQVAGACGAVTYIFYLSLPGFTMERLGLFTAAMAVANLVLTFPIGWLADKFHPVRLVFWALIWFPIVSIVSFFIVHDYWTLIVATILSFAPGLFYGVAVAPMMMLLFPKERYGQFGSADAIGRSISTILMGLVAGFFLSQVQYVYQNVLGIPGNGFYRWMYIWQAVFNTVAWLLMWRVYAGWKKYGGIKNYVPPSVGPLQGEEEPAAN